MKKFFGRIKYIFVFWFIIAGDRETTPKFLKSLGKPYRAKSI